MSFKVPERYRVRESGQWSGRTGDPFGVFVIPSSSRNGMLRIIASSDEGWEHVSVSLAHRCRGGREMSDELSDRELAEWMAERIDESQARHLATPPETL